MDKTAFFHLTYGLYLLTAREGGRDYGCVINTAIQAASDPDRLAISVLKRNRTHEALERQELFCLSVLSAAAPFELFRRFGMQSARDTDKFADFPHLGREENGLAYLTKDCSAWLTARVTERLDLGSHSLFIAEVIGGGVLNGDGPCTYAHYQAHIKPKAQKKQTAQWECTVCGYVYQGEEVPENFICPLCSHGKEAFVKIN